MTFARSSHQSHIYDAIEGKEEKARMLSQESAMNNNTRTTTIKSIQVPFDELVYCNANAIEENTPQYDTPNPLRRPIDAENPVVETCSTNEALASEDKYESADSKYIVENEYASLEELHTTEDDPRVPPVASQHVGCEELTHEPPPSPMNKVPGRVPATN